MSILRPEAAALLLRYREVIAAGGAAALALWWLWRWWAEGTWLLGGLALIVLPGAVVLMRQGLLRARFSRGGMGPGLVRVHERLIVYYGPLGGGTVAVPNITRLELRPEPDGPVWHLHHSSGSPLAIPVDAEGGEALFDALAALPGLDPAHLVAALDHAETTASLVWSRDPAGAALPRS